MATPGGMADWGLAGVAAGGRGPVARRGGTLARWLIAGRGLMLTVLPRRRGTADLAAVICNFLVHGAST
jgi:hypothetical protein